MQQNLDGLNIKMKSWDKKFINLALHIAEWSHDPSTKVGAIIVDDVNNVRAIGYNGFPRLVKDTVERLSDRPTKYALTTHAEINALLSCTRSGVATDGYTLVCTHYPCSTCAGAIIQAGIKNVITIMPSDDLISRWETELNIAKLMFNESGVTVVEYISGL
jgi:dCMP deaminase